MHSSKETKSGAMNGLEIQQISERKQRKCVDWQNVVERVLPKNILERVLMEEMTREALIKVKNEKGAENRMGELY